MNLAFFEQLTADRDFCAAIGRMTLAAGRLESDVRAFLTLKGIKLSGREATFGSLVAMLEKHNLLSENGLTVLRELKFQRNYLTHSLFDLFSGRIPETVLPRTDLIAMDVDMFTDKALQLEENLLGLAHIAEQRISVLLATPSSVRDVDARLFRP